MTLQIPDSLDFRGQRYALTARQGSGLFDPGDYAIVPQGWNTAVYRGCICTYAVVDDQLIVSDVEIGFEVEPPVIHDVSAVATTEATWRYVGLNVPMTFSGGLLVGRGDPDGLPYLNMGYAPAWFYTSVWDVRFTDGHLDEARDLSAEMEFIRRRRGAAGVRPAVGEDIQEWIARTFSLSYEYSWPPRASLEAE